MLLADTVQLLQDINTDSQSTHTNPDKLAAVNGTVFFSGLDADAGRELMATDGTAVGTRVVRDINPGVSPSNPVGLADVNGTLFFFADDGTHGFELWKSDGTAAGTVMVKDITPGIADSLFRPNGNTTPPEPRVTTMGGRYYFIVQTQTGSSLWKSDGTDAGTVPVVDPVYDGNNVLATTLGATSNTVYFTHEAGPTGLELWKTDGTPGGATLVKDIIPGPGSSFPLSYTPVGNLMYFTAAPVADGDPNHRALFRTDGTADGTFAVADRVVYDVQRAAVGNTLFFVTGTEGTDTQPGADSDLWKTDGTAAGTVKVKDFIIDPGNRPTRVLGTYSGGVLFTAYDEVHGTSFWKSDGTPGGTVLIKDFTPGFPDGNAPQAAQEVNGTIWLSGYDRVRGFELWKSDGTTAGTVFVNDIVAGGESSLPRQFVAAGNGRVVFVANSIPPGQLGYVEWDVYSADATSGLTQRLRPAKGPTGSSSPHDFIFSGDNFYFIAGVPGQGLKLLRSDGTPGHVAQMPGGPELVQRILGETNGVVFYAGQDTPGRTQVWRTDGTAAGTVMLAEAQNVSGSMTGEAVGDTFYFGIQQDLWKSDGTPQGTELVRTFPPQHFPFETGHYPRNLTDLDGTLLFFATDGEHGVELWRSDGTYTGTRMVEDIYPGPNESSSSDPQQTMTLLNGEAYFVARTPDAGPEVWKTDGTEAGTVMLRDVRPGSQFGLGNPFGLVRFGDRIYFAEDIDNSFRLFETDGTSAGTVPAKIQGDKTLTNVWGLYAYGGRLYVNAAEAGVPGRNLYGSDGTPGNLTLLRSNFVASAFQGLGGKVYMSGRDESMGSDDSVNKLYVTDGTPQGTGLLAPIYPGGPFGDVPGMTPGDGVVVLAATSPQDYGREPWVIIPEGRVVKPRNAAVVGRHVFYNNSTFDGGGTGAADDAAVAPDKQALLPGQTATFANVTSYNRGVNGVMIDVAGLPQDAELSADDFFFRAGQAGAPASLVNGPTGFTVTVRRGAGANGSDRVVLTWPDYNPAAAGAAARAQAVANRWLQVTMRATDDTGLASPDVFYFGNLIGETGDSGDLARPLAVSALDMASLRRSLAPTADALITSAHDFNRDGKVNALDLAVIRGNLARRLPLFAFQPDVAPPAPTVGATSLVRES